MFDLAGMSSRYKTDTSRVVHSFLLYVRWCGHLRNGTCKEGASQAEFEDNNLPRIAENSYSSRYAYGMCSGMDGPTAMRGEKRI